MQYVKPILYRCGKALAVVMLCASAHAQMALPRHAPYPGGVAVVKLNAPGNQGPATAMNVTYGGHRVLTVKLDDDLFGIVGIPLDATPGTQKLHISAAQGTLQLAYETGFEIKPKAYPTQHLKIDPRFLKLSPENQQRNERDQPLIAAAKKHWSDTPPETFTLDLPAAGRLSARFGIGRTLNGRESSPHGGLDVAVGTGTPLRAAAAGRVIATDDYFYSGKSVWVDHGQGFITLYIHMSRIDVKAGDSVERGATLGLSGATGRVTGPHLHWAVLLNGVYVDPELFLKVRP